ncbi:hypothetical protein GOV03_04995 [Candidatus Woesearchaeota archaeon]|nr:hypothetical protein [Candidatus Woesearchaeota archaeon]
MKINIFDTYAEVIPLLKQYVKDNWIVRDEIDERAKVKDLSEDCSNLGSGLELICAIELEVDTTEDQAIYVFNATLFSPDTDHEYTSVSGLVPGIQKYLETQDRFCLGARISPFVYTVEEVERFTKEGKTDLKDSVLKLAQLKGTSPQELKRFEELFKMSIDLKPHRGLTAEEIKEVERLYNLK